MAFELKENSGTLFNNSRKTTDNHPDYTGEINVGGKIMWLSAWIKQSKSGTKYISIQVKDKEDQRQKSTAAPKGDSGFNDMSDIPFIDPYKFNWRAV